MRVQVLCTYFKCLVKFCVHTLNACSSFVYMVKLYPDPLSYVTAIDGLPNDSNGLPPSPFAVVYVIVPPQQQNWLQHNHTEMVEVSESKICNHFYS